MKGVVSEDVVRRAMQRIDEATGLAWLAAELRDGLAPILSQPWIAAPAVLPHKMRRCTVLPCNPRIRQSFRHTASLFRKRCAPRIGSHKV